MTPRRGDDGSSTSASRLAANRQGRGRLWSSPTDALNEGPARLVIVVPIPRLGASADYSHRPSRPCHRGCDRQPGRSAARTWGLGQRPLDGRQRSATCSTSTSAARLQRHRHRRMTRATSADGGVRRGRGHGRCQGRLREWCNQRRWPGAIPPRPRAASNPASRRGTTCRWR